MNKWFVGVWKSVVVLLGIVIGTLVYLQFKPLELAAATTMSQILSSDTTSLFIFPLEFDFGVIIAFMFCYLALLINELGSIQSVGSMLNLKDMNQRTQRGVAVQEFRMFLQVLLSYWSGRFLFSPGIISATRCASRFVLIPAGVGLILISLFPGVVSILNQTPSLVIGAIMFYLMITQLASGFNLMQEQKAVLDFESALVIGFPIMLAVLVSFLPPAVVEAIPLIVRPILTNGFVMGVITVIICEHFILGRKGLNSMTTIVFYDNQCNVCNYWVNWILDNDSNSVFYFAALESNSLKSFPIISIMSFQKKL